MANSADQVEAGMRLCGSDRAYARKLGAPRVKALVRAYMKLHPSWSTNGNYDSSAYALGNRVMGVAQDLEREKKAEAKRRREEKKIAAWRAKHGAV